MDIEAFRGVREGPIGRRIVVVAAVSLAAALMIVGLAIALAPPRPPGSILSGTTWQWTGATGGSANASVVVPDPSRYTIAFLPDSTFRATADCIDVTGTYVRVLAGRNGLPTTGLRLQPGPLTPASCGADSLSDTFLQGLWAATRYRIVDSRLLISSATQGTMTFDVAGPAADAPGGA